MIGSKLAHYEITGHLGSGGMGDVYQATDSKLGRSVAIKLLPELFARDADRVARFEREARVLASLNHPNIAAIFGVEDSDGRKFLVMELAPGETLAARIARGAIPVDDALAIARQMCEALEAAHEKGIVHRDLKPANVKIAADGKVKVLDFGLAKAFETEPSNANLSNSPTMVSMAATNAGIILGTAAYMSPEQARGVGIDHRSDIFSFGLVFYEMLTGRQAFEGDTVSDLLAAVLKSEPDLKQLPQNLNPRLYELLSRSLRKNARQRWQAIGDVRLEIESIAAQPFREERPAETFVKRPLWKRAIPVAIASVVFATIGAVAAWYAHPSPATTVTRFPFTLPAGQQFTNAARQLVSISPDGEQFVYVADHRLYLKPMHELSSIFIQGTEVAEGVANPVFSPDSRSLAFYSVADRTIKRIAVTGGAPTTIAPVENSPFGMSWGPDNQILVGQGNKGILRVSANGGKPETIITMKESELAHGPQILPGSEEVLFTFLSSPLGDDRWDKAQIVVQSLKSGERKVLVERGSDAHYVSTGHLIYALSGTLLAVPFDIKRLAVTGSPVPVIEGIRAAGVNTGTYQYSVSDNGTLVFIPGPVASSGPIQHGLASVDRTGGSKPLEFPLGPYFAPRISPNGKQLAFHTDDGKEQIVWIYDLDGKSSMRRLTFGGKNTNPAWSPDGQHVLFTSDREGDQGLFWQRADGTGVAERVTKPDGGWITHIAEAWDRDGQTFLFSASKIGDGSIWAYSLRDKKSSMVIDARGFQSRAAFSPDGHWVAYESYENQPVTTEVYVQPYPSTGATLQITKNGGNHPLWSPDGKELFFMNNVVNGQLFSVDVRTQPSFTFGNPVALPLKGFVQTAALTRQFDITPDGKQFIVVMPPVTATTEGPRTLQIQVVLNWTEELKQRVPVR